MSHSGRRILAKNTLQDNNYPKKLINAIFSQNRAHTRTITNREENNVQYFKIPFIKNLSHEIKNVLGDEHNRIVFYNTKSLGQLFNRSKDKCPKALKSNVIYKITCECGQHYIGQTKQWLKSRMYSHQYDITKKKTNTALAMHASNTTHKFDFEDVKILDTESNLGKRLLLEMIHINCTENCVNQRKDIEGLSNIYGNLLKIQET